VGLVVAGANRPDLKLVKDTVESLVIPRPRPTKTRPQGMCLDKGDDYAEVRDTLQEFGFTAHMRARGEEAQVLKRQAGVRARRWVGERTHSWMNRFRRVLIRWGSVRNHPNLYPETPACRYAQRGGEDDVVSTL
jgi:putative transposase